MISSRVPPQRKLSLIFGVLAVLVCVLVGAPANAQRDGRVTTADKGDSPRVKVLLDAKVDANSAPLYRVSFGQAAVEPAAAPKSSTRAATASAQGPTVVVDSLVGAVARGDMAVLRARLSSGANPNTSDDSKVKGWTPLMEAAYSGNVEATRLLLDAGAKIDAKNKFGATALDVAVLGGKTQVAEFLRSRGAKGTQGTQGIQANAQGDFINAASKGYLSLVKALLAAKADVNAKDYDGETALIAAAAQGHADVVKLLLNAGADKNAKDKQGYTALIVAAGHGDAEVVKLLLDVGADKNANVYSYASGDTALIAAAAQGHADVVKLLLDAGANKEAKDIHNEYWEGSDGRPVRAINYATPLIHAAAEGHADVVKLLLDAGANKEAKDYWGNTALKEAKYYNHADVVKLLLDAGATK